MMTNNNDRLRVSERCLLPLYVDLDGTLVLTDTLHESIIGALKVNPFLFLLMPFWLIRGKAYLKAKITDYFIPASALLPYNKRLVEYLQRQKKLGRSVILATAANKAVADAVARHVGIFDHIIASEQVNLKGKKKLAAILSHCHDGGFVYAGNSKEDLFVWEKAEQAVIAGHDRKVRAAVYKSEIFVEYDVFKKVAPFISFFKELRVYQWAKNILIFTSLVLSHQIFDITLLINCFLAFTAFCLCSSGVYLLNDLFDLEVDRCHVIKKMRPLAAGALSTKNGVIGAMGLFFIGALVASQLPVDFRYILACYLGITSVYSIFLKQKELIDVIVLALLYTIRIIAGSAAIQIATTQWLLGFSLFLFLSLALAKRYSELHSLQPSSNSVVPGRGYRVEDIEQLAIFGTVSGYISVLVLALYINSPDVIQRYHAINFLWAICILLVYWVSRIWLLTRRGELHEDPVVFTLHDKVSYWIGLGVVILLVLATR